MPKRVILPRNLTTAPFHVTDAYPLGVGEGRLRSLDLARPFHGVRSAVTAADVVGRAAEYLPVIGDGFFSHLTAALLWGVPLPRALEATDILHVSAHAPGRAPRGRNIAGHSLSLARVVHRFGMPVTTPERTWLMLASVLGWRDLVAAADHLILDPEIEDPRDPRPYTDVGRLAWAAERYRGRGARRALAAIPWIRQGAESRPETHYRLRIVEAGLPEPELQVAVEGIRRDMYFARWRTIAEYDGEQHRTSTAQWEKDERDRAHLRRVGIEMARARKTTLFGDPVGAVALVAEALERQGWRR